MLKFLYAIIFGLIGSVIGFIAAAASLIFGLGVFWLVLFGDNPWPAWTEVIFGPVPFAVFILVVIASVILGIRHGKRKEFDTDQQIALKTARKRLLIVFIVWVVLIAVFVVSVTQQQRLTSAEIVVQIQRHGGLCPNGMECQSTFTVYNDDSYKNYGGMEGRITPLQSGQLTSVIISADFEEIKSRKFTGTCPTAYDDSEIIYTFYLPNEKVEVIASCQVEINFDEEPFKTIRNIQRTYK